MQKRRNLNGLPNNLARSYFSTLNYHRCGYMADWLVNGARILQLKEATIDILNETIEPSELNLYPLTVYFKNLKKIIEKELTKNGFQSDFITEAKMKVHFFNPFAHPDLIYCFPLLTDKEGHKYEHARIVESSSEKKFDPFKEMKKSKNPTINSRILTLFKKLIS